MNPFKPLVKDPLPKDIPPPDYSGTSSLQPVDTNGRLKLLIIIVIIVSLVWGLVGSLELFIVSFLQTIFPTRTKLQYAILQIFIYIILLAIIIFVTDIDVTNLFISTDHLKLSQ